MALQTFHLAHLPSDLPVHVALYQDVRNSAFLKQQLLNGNADFEYAFVDAATILSTVHALSAVYRAINDHLQGRRRSKNVHAEIVYSLSPNNNITESFRRFGITESTRALLVIKVSTSQTITHDSVQQHLGSIIDGTATQFSNETLESMTDLARVRKIYKLTDGQPSKHRKSGKKSTAEDIVTPWTGNAGCWNFGDAENAILGAMALRGAS